MVAIQYFLLLHPQAAVVVAGQQAAVFQYKQAVLVAAHQLGIQVHLQQMQVD